MFDLKYVVRDYYNNCIIQKKSLQEFINRRFNSPNHAVVNTDFVKVVGTSEYSIYLDDCVTFIEEVETHYCYEDLRKSDIILDIGANIGLFSLKVKNKANEIFAVEPLFHERLLKNIELNRAENIHVMPYALGKNDEKINIEYIGKKNTVQSYPLSKLKALCGGHVDFLKCDCEGGEWFIQPQELDGIRRLEVEIHCFEGENPADFTNMLAECGFEVNFEMISKRAALAHAFRN